MLKQISKIMWGIIIGLFVFSFVIDASGGSGELLAYYTGYIAGYAFIVQIILWLIERRRKIKIDKNQE